RLLACLCGLLFPAFSSAGECVRLVVEPTEVVLRGPWDRVQLVVAGQDAQDNLQDLTNSASFQLSNIVAISPTGTVRPRQNGTGLLVVAQGSLEAKVPVRVEGMDGPSPVSFTQQIEPT